MGTVAHYQPLASTMPANVWGVEHGFLRTGDESHLLHDSLEELAHEHAAQMRDMQSSASCPGGAIARAREEYVKSIKKVLEKHWQSAEYY